MGIKEGIAKFLLRYVSQPPQQIEKVIVEKIKLVEVPVLRTQSGWDREQRETVSTLSAHPGFVLLTDRLALQGSALKTKLNADRHPGIRDVEFLQSGIFWCAWLQNQVAAATTRTAVRRQDAAEEDVAAIREIESAYNRVGEV